jgi:hypothetical protein
MSAKKLLSLEQELTAANPMMPQGNSPCFEASDMPGALAKHLRDLADPTADPIRHSLSDADLIFLLGAALLDSQRTGR